MNKFFKGSSQRPTSSSRSAMLGSLLLCVRFELDTQSPRWGRKINYGWFSCLWKLPPLKIDLLMFTFYCLQIIFYLLLSLPIIVTKNIMQKFKYRKLLPSVILHTSIPVELRMNIGSPPPQIKAAAAIYVLAWFYLNHSYYYG